jgi:hypothetical protein
MQKNIKICFKKIIIKKVDAGLQKPKKKKKKGPTHSRTLKSDIMKQGRRPT